MRHTRGNFPFRRHGAYPPVYAERLVPAFQAFSCQAIRVKASLSQSGVRWANYLSDGRVGNIATVGAAASTAMPYSRQ